MKMIEDQTRVNGRNCITFKARSNEASYVHIYNGQGCNSYVGKLYANSPQKVNARVLSRMLSFSKL